MTRGFLASPGLIHAPATATSLGARRSSRCSVVSRANVGLSVAGVDMKITDERIAFEERALEVRVSTPCELALMKM